jgi:methanogenic corrinoid protein MtbC1
MVFLRTKVSRGRPYAQLVENRWDPAQGYPRQRVVCYLGRLDRIRPEMIPPEYRTPSVLRSLERMVQKDRERMRGRIDALRRELEEALLRGDVEGSRQRARQAIRLLGAERFLGDLIPEAMHSIGQAWFEGRISVSEEHLASGIASVLLASLRWPSRTSRPLGPEVVLCAPEGEDHTLALSVAAHLLRRKGYNPVNIGGSAPHPSILQFVRDHRPAAVWISFTRPDLWPRAKSLAVQLCQMRMPMRVTLGGQGLSAVPPDTRLEGVDLVRVSMIDYLKAWPEGSQGPAGSLGGGGPPELPPQSFGNMDRQVWKIQPLGTSSPGRWGAQRDSGS